jgi:hypothetical protein
VTSLDALGGGCGADRRPAHRGKPAGPHAFRRAAVRAAARIRALAAEPLRAAKVPSATGRSAAWLARPAGGREVVSSNLTAPITETRWKRRASSFQVRAAARRPRDIRAHSGSPRLMQVDGSPLRPPPRRSEADIEWRSARPRRRSAPLLRCRRHGARPRRANDAGTTDHHLPAWRAWLRPQHPQALPCSSCGQRAAHLPRPSRSRTKRRELTRPLEPRHMGRRHSRVLRRPRDRETGHPRPIVRRNGRPRTSHPPSRSPGKADRLQQHGEVPRRPRVGDVRAPAISTASAARR